jgi:hypothetical protein
MHYYYHPLVCHTASSLPEGRERPLKPDIAFAPVAAIIVK